MYKIRLRERTKRKLTKLKPYTNTLKSIFNILEVKGVTYGKLLCPKTQLYEVKRHRPPLRVYYTLKDQHIVIVDIELKKNTKKQQALITKLKAKIFSGIRFLFFS